MISCKDFVDFIMAYLDSDLSESERSAFEEHIEMCPPCVNYLRNYQQTVELGASLCRDPEGPVPDQVPEGLVNAVLAARRTSRSR